MKDFFNQAKEATLSETPSEETAVSKDKKKKQGLLADLYDWLEVFAISIAAVFILFAFVTRVAVVDGDSMNDTLKNQERLLVQELFYTPKQGDIIVCQSTFFGFDNPLVKRIVATEGQTIAIDPATWTVTVDGVPLEEDYIKRISGRDMVGLDAAYGGSYTVPEGHVFVMGDNRNGSWDSRDIDIGPIDVRHIVGKVFFRISPFDGFGPVS